MRVPELKDNRTVSVSIERKSQIPVKSPPEFIKSKLFHEHQQIRYKNVWLYDKFSRRNRKNIYKIIYMNIIFKFK